jgi:hypothetical protein
MHGQLGQERDIEENRGKTVVFNSTRDTQNNRKMGNQ